MQIDRLSHVAFCNQNLFSSNDRVGCSFTFPPVSQFPPSLTLMDSSFSQSLSLTRLGCPFSFSLTSPLSQTQRPPSLTHRLSLVSPPPPLSSLAATTKGSQPLCSRCFAVCSATSSHQLAVRREEEKGMRKQKNVLFSSLLSRLHKLLP